MLMSSRDKQSTKQPTPTSQACRNKYTIEQTTETDFHHEDQTFGNKHDNEDGTPVNDEKDRIEI
jgi:hypothetical protein